MFYNTREELLQNIFLYEQNGGKFVIDNFKIRCHWIHLNVYEESKKTLIQLIEHQKKNTNLLVSDSSFYFREGLSIDSGGINNITNYCNTTIIVAYNELEALQWLLLLKKTKLKIAYIVRKRKTIPDNVDIILTYGQSHYHQLTKQKYIRSILSHDFNNRTVFYQNCRFVYTVVTSPLVYKWQQYQSFCCLPNRKTYLQPIVYFQKYHPSKHYDFCNFIQESFLDYVENETSANSKDEFNWNCSICYEEQTIDIINLQCNHVICESCFQNLQQFRMMKCPVCRQSFADTTIVQKYRNKKILKPYTFYMSEFIKNKRTSANIVHKYFKCDKNNKNLSKLYKGHINHFFTSWDVFMECDLSFVQASCVLVKLSTTQKELNLFLKSFFSSNRTETLDILFLHVEDFQKQLFIDALNNYFV